MKNYKYLIALLFILTLVTGMASGLASPVRAQSEDGWTDPVNLSNSGSSTNPAMVIDSIGTIHVFWFDQFADYKYAQSTDGVTWSEPKSVDVPFSTQPDSLTKPVFLAGPDGTIHILWQDEKGALQYRRSPSSTLGAPSGWIGDVKLAASAIQFDAAVDSQGTLHVGYVNNRDEEKEPAGIYYRRLELSSGWSAATMIYPSKYFRSLKLGDDANIQLASTSNKDAVDVYMAWDDRFQRRVFLAKSADGGKAWEGAFEVRGPEDFSGLEMPYNINLGAVEDQVLLTWQAGVPEGQCVQYSQWSTDAAKTFGQPVKVLDGFAQCPQSDQFLLTNKDFSVVQFTTFSDLSLMAWDGSQWSKQLTQSDMASFINPVTLDNVILGCQYVISVSDKVYLVGCDTGQGGDIWFSSRPVGVIQDWFTPPSRWSQPEVLAEADQRISSLSSIADNSNNVHNIWIEKAPDGRQGAMFRYARWNGEKWTEPATVISGPDLNPSQLTLSLDTLGKLLLAWVDHTTGDMYFTWTISDGASSPSEWQTPVFIPSVSSANSSPDIVTDASGRMILAYAVPINEDRGIYIVESDDLGASWSKPARVFDASATNWHLVDRPNIALTGDGRLHILFERYTLLGDQRRSDGLYYIQSSDGGFTWIQPEQVSEHPILWSDLVSHGKSDIHRIWQEAGDTTKVSLHQFSSDGGSTWSTRNTISTLSDEIATNRVSMDPSGKLHYLQLTGPEGPSVLYQRWEQSGWKVRSPKILDIDPEAWNPSSIASSISSDGHLVASLLGSSPEVSSRWQSEILSLSQFLEPSDPIPTPYPALISAAPVVAGTQTSLNVSETSTPDTLLASIDDSQSLATKNRNLVGLLLLGGVVAFLVFILLATSRSKNKGKTKTT